MHIFEKTGIRDRFELALHGLRLATARRDGSGADDANEWAESTPRLASTD